MPNSVRQKHGRVLIPGVECAETHEKREKFQEALDFVEEGLYDVFWALVVTLGERLGDEVFVG